MTPTERLTYRYILKTRVYATSYRDTTRRILEWAKGGESRYVCFANVHTVMAAYDNDEYATIINDADLVTPDGMPLVWGLRRLGCSRQQRVYGPTLTLHACEAAAREGIPIGLFGGTEESIEKFSATLQDKFPDIKIVCRIAPPFQDLFYDDDSIYTKEIADSGARLVLVGLGCPKQERWMAEHTTRIPAVLLGVGAAFDFLSGRVRQAPEFLQRIGLEWLFRLCMEPRRLWKRYYPNNPKFVLLFGIQLLRTKLGLEKRTSGKIQT